MKKVKIYSDVDHLQIELVIEEPETVPKAIVQISHGMEEHKERYEEFIRYLAKKGYIVVIHDHRGHGSSVKKKEDLGYFYTMDSSVLVEDLHQVTEYIKNEYPDLPVYLFSHSMGTLVARNYLKKYDNAIDKLVLCGPPTENKAVDFGLFLIKNRIRQKGEKYKSAFINKLAIEAFNEGYNGKNQWICSDQNVVDRYNEDELCGFGFTLNGFYHLFSLQKNAYKKTGWEMHHPELPIFLIAGECDPVIHNAKKFYHLKRFLYRLGYHHVRSKLYHGQRHEILNEKDRQKTYRDIVVFFHQKR